MYTANSYTKAVREAEQRQQMEVARRLMGGRAPIHAVQERVDANREKSWAEILSRYVSRPENVFKPQQIGKTADFQPMFEKTWAEILSRYVSQRDGVSATPAKATEQPAPKPSIADKPIWDMRLDDYRICIAAMPRPYEF